MQTTLIDAALNAIIDNQNVGTITQEIVQNITRRIREKGSVTPKQAVWLANHTVSSTALLAEIAEIVERKATLTDQQTALAEFNDMVAAAASVTAPPATQTVEEQLAVIDRAVAAIRNALK